MRISQLDLKAYGHFTNRRICFDGGADFHLAYGPNEAGKTTISRALHAALFGVPERTTDNHLHLNPDLRVGVVLEAQGGTRLAAMRRKARKNSLVKYDPNTGEELGEAIADEQLSILMRGLGQNLFVSMFGIDHDGLVAGGAALVDGKGEIGQSLFAAGAGLASVKALRDRLTGEADNLFRPRASTSVIYKVLDEYGVARKDSKAAQTRPADWEMFRKTAESAKREYDAAREKQETLQRDARRLERLSALLPDVAARGDAIRRITTMNEVTKLPSDAAASRIAAETRLREANRRHQEALANAAHIRAEADAIVLPTSLLSEAGAIESLYYSLDVFRTAREAGASAKGRWELANKRVTVLLAAIGGSLTDDARSLIPNATLRSRVQRLITSSATLQGEIKSAMDQADSAHSEITELAEELAELGTQKVPASLSELLANIENEGNPEAKAEDLGKEVARLWHSTLRETAAMTDKSIEAIVSMGTPLSAEIQHFREHTDDLEGRKKALKEKIEIVEDDIAIVEGEIEGLTLAVSVQTAEKLTIERGIRDTLWQRIRRTVFPDPNQHKDENVLPTAAEYETSVRTADDTADGRFADAARVTQYAELQKRLIQMRKTINLERNRFIEAELAANELDKQWKILIEKYGLPPLNVLEMRDWLTKRELVLNRHGTYVEKKADADTTTGRAIELRKKMTEALIGAGLPPCDKDESLAQAIARTRGFLNKVSENTASRTILAKKKKDAEGKLATAEDRIAKCKKTQEDWQVKWKEAMLIIRLDVAADGAEAETRLQQFDDLEEALDALDREKSVLETAQRTVSQVETEIQRLCQSVTFDRGTMLADGITETLHQQLVHARAEEQHLKTIESQINNFVWTSEQAALSASNAEQDLATLMAVAKSGSLSELAEAEKCSTEYQKLEITIAEIESKLVQGSGMALVDFLAQAEGQDLALVKASLDQASSDLDASKTQVEELHKKVIETETALGLVDGESVAAVAEQAAMDAAARLSTLVTDYSATRLASAILGEVIEAYQQRHQGPMLARASELFAAITGGRFAKMATDFDEDMTVLVAVRPGSDGKRLTMDKLSAGRRDQLFLALRLAAIYSHVASEEPMPVVLDDILINFDDEASSATFQVLADLSKKTQVLFFTHHEHLLEKASIAIGKTHFTSHAL